MPLVLRVDVDKPFGRANFKEKVLSKVREDYWFPAISSIGYLYHLKRFLSFLSVNEIRAHIYFRKCTLPPNSWLDESILDEHMLGLHADSTRNFNTFKKELEEVQAYFSPRKLTSFTKHGSGKWKGGRNHYPLYEPDKYLQWSKTLSIPFLFGNRIVEEPSEFYCHDQFYPSMFWINNLHRDCERFTLQWAIDVAKENNVIVIIHPANFVACEQVRDDMRKLVSLARQQNVSWITL